MKKNQLIFSVLLILSNQSLSHEFLIHQEIALSGILDPSGIHYVSVPYSSSSESSGNHLISLDEASMLTLLDEAHSKDVKQQRIKMSNIQIAQSTNQGSGQGGQTNNQTSHQNNARKLPFCDSDETKIRNIPEAKIISRICGFEVIDNETKSVGVDDFHLARYAAIEYCQQVEATLAEEYIIEDKHLLPLFHGPETFVTFEGVTDFGTAAYGHHSNYNLSEDGLDFECVYIMPDFSGS